MTLLSGSLDTNVLLRLLLNDLPDQHRAVENLLANPLNHFTVADTAIIRPLSQPQL